MPLPSMANDLSFLKKWSFGEFPILPLGKGKLKPNIYLLNFIVKNSKWVDFCNYITDKILKCNLTPFH